jgi:glucan phosphoethanolaminetransferase (alkaline phosphatase superfamily)
MTAFGTFYGLLESKAGHYFDSPYPMNSLLSILRKTLTHALIALAAAVLLIIPDHLYDYISGKGLIAFRPLTLAVMFVIFFLLLALRSRLAFIGVLGLFFLLQLGELLHIAYFGTSFSPHEILLLFTELDEINQSVSGVLGLMIPPVLIVIASYAALAVLIRVSARHRLHLPVAALPVFLLLLVLPVQAYTSNRSQRFYPNPITYSIENGLKAFSFFIGNEVPGLLAGKKAKLWDGYTLEKTSQPVRANIVVIMGESLTPAHMSLFGYGRETTPMLESLRADGLIYQPGIAAGVATKVTLPMFFNVTREPGSPQHIVKQESNLVKMAKGQGFAIHYYSVQTANLATYSGIEYADRKLTEEDVASELETRHDAVLFDPLKKVNLAQPNFIVLHQRGSHSPYDRNYPPQFAHYRDANASLNQQRIDTYDNSVRYTDYFVHSVIDYLKSHSDLPVYVLFTSDHGEMVGEKDGLFGHGMLTKEAALVPFVFYAHRGDAAQLAKARLLKNPTHYEMGELIASLLGYQIRNPNQEAGIYYLNGTDLSGKSGFKIVDKTSKDWKLADPRPGKDL